MSEMNIPHWMRERMSPARFAEIRKNMGLTQTGVAEILDISLRTVQSIESGKESVPFAYHYAIERIALRVAAWSPDPEKAPANVREDAMELVAWEIEFAAANSKGRYSIPKRDMIDFVNPGRNDNPKRGALLKVADRSITFDANGIGAKLPVGHSDPRGSKVIS